MNARATEAGPQVSASIQLDAALTAIAKRDVNIRAFVRLAPDARDVAAGLDAASTRGPLQGWPIAIKDIIATRNLGTEYGSAIYEGHVPDVDADCVRRLKEAGAVIIGKTATTEFAQLHPAATRNPRDLSRTPGGSSSGSAAAVAAGMARAALGSQTGGSVIRPASYCGVFGFKSSIGRTDTRGVHELARSFDTVGWFARDAADLSTLGQVLLVDSRSPETQRAPRIVRLRTPFDARADSYMHALCDDVAARLGSAGASLVEMPAPASWALLEALHQRIVSVEASRAFASYDGRLSPILTAFVATGRENEATYAAALAEAELERRAFNSMMEVADALLLPAATGEAPVGLGFTGDSVFSLGLSLIGAPCVSLPAGIGPSGVPIGVQLVGRCGHDEMLLQTAMWAADRLKIAL